MTLQQVEDNVAQVASIRRLEDGKAPVVEALDALGVDPAAFVDAPIAIEQQFRLRLLRSGTRREDLPSLPLPARIQRSS